MYLPVFPVDGECLRLVFTEWMLRGKEVFGQRGAIRAPEIVLIVEDGVGGKKAPPATVHGFVGFAMWTSPGQRARYFGQQKEKRVISSGAAVVVLSGGAAFFIRTPEVLGSSPPRSTFLPFTS